MTCLSQSIYQPSILHLLFVNYNVAEFLEKVEECKINASSKLVSKKIGSTKLVKGCELVSFDIVSLYTIVPLIEVIEYCTDLLYSKSSEVVPNLDKETLRLLCELCSCNVLMSTQDGY